MHPIKTLLLVGLGAAAATAENDSACSPVSPIFITVPTSPTIETIYPLSKGSVTTFDVEALVNDIPRVTSTPITTTVTVSLISNQIVTIIPATSPGPVEGQAAYSFAEENGTTTWLGATPPSSASLVTSTQVVTLQPVPTGYSAPPGEILPVTSYVTLSSTETIVETHTETQTLTIFTASAAGAYTGLAPNGWNSSKSTFITATSPIGSVTIIEKLAQYSGTVYPIAPSGVVPYSSGDKPGPIKARDITDIVVATIDGVAVSWTNNWGETPLSSSGTSQTVVPVTATALPRFLTAPTTTIGVLSSNTSAASNAVVTTAAPSCGDASADFIIDFDDLPAFSAAPGDTDIPPIFNPYHKLFFQEYFGYVPPPSDPFPPISAPQLAVYRADGSGVTSGLELTGEIGSGPRASESAYWIDAYSAYLGCTNAGPDDCSIMVKGYQITSSFSYITQGFTLPPCPGIENCSLTLVEFADGFRNLTGLQIIAKVGNTAVDWYMDDLSLGWSNNTCEAQLERSSQD